MSKICVELIEGTTGLQKGYISVLVRMGDEVVQTPWVIGGTSVGNRILASVMVQLKENYPDKEICGKLCHTDCCQRNNKG